MSDGPVSNDSRSEVLGRVRRALGTRGASLEDEYRRLPREYIREGTMPAAAKVELFEERIVDYDATVRHSAAADVRQAIEEVLAARGKRRLAVPLGLPDEWKPGAPVELVPDTGLDNVALDACDGVLTACTVCIALTGTIVLTHSPAEGRRALTLVPDYHLCVVRADQIVETVSEGLRAAWRAKPTVVTTISGPSATADIEMTRIKGVHGPRTLDVVLVV
jgi:L-lactate dehydrogenase complex protein LldG